MAHGQSSDPIRRAGWLAVACGLAVVSTGLTTGCHGPEKDDGLKSLDPATKQKLLGIAPPGGKPGSGNATVDQRFNRTTPIKLPAPELGSGNPVAALPTGQPTGMPPLPQSVGVVAAPTRPTGNTAVMPLQPAPPSVDPVIRTANTVPQPLADPLRDLPPVGGLPVPGGSELPGFDGPVIPGAGGPAMPSTVLPVAPAPGVLPNPIQQELPPVSLPTIGGGQPIPPLPGQSTVPLPAVPSITDLPPLVK